MRWVRKWYRRIRRVCLHCGDVPIPKGDPKICWDCSLTLIGDFDELMRELREQLDNKPLYFEDE